MSNTKSTASPPTADASSGLDEVVQPVPIEVTVAPPDPAVAGRSSGPRPRALRALPAAVFGAEALTVGGAGLYTATGVVGTVAVAGAAAGVATVAGAAAAVRRTRSRMAGRRPHGGYAASAGGRSGRRSAGLASAGWGGAASGSGRGRGARGRGHGSLGLASHAGGGLLRRGSRKGLGGGTSSGVSTPRSTAGAGHASRRGGLVGGSASGGSVGSRHGQRLTGGSRGAGRRLLGGRGHAGRVGTGSAGARTVGAGGSGRWRGAAAARVRGVLGRKNAKAGAGGEPMSSSGASAGVRRRGTGRAMVAAGVARARRAGAPVVRAGAHQVARVAAAAGPVARKAWAVGRAGVRRAAATSVGRFLRSWWQRLRKRARERASRAARGVGAAVAAGAAGALAAVPGLLLAGAAAVAGGVLRWMRLVPRGRMWGRRFLRWGPVVAVRIWRLWVIRTQVAVHFPIPGRSLAPAVGSGSYFGGQHVSRFVLHTEGVRDAYAHYDPPSMLAVKAEYMALPHGIRAVAEAVLELAVNSAEKYPADKRVAESVAEVYARVMQAADKAGEVFEVFLKEHEHDLMRFEAPRTNEQMWNIASRRPDGSIAMRPSVFALACSEVEQTYTRYEPESMAEVAAEYEGIPTGLENIAAAVSFLAVKSAEEYPVEKPVAETVTEVHHLLMRAASTGQELFPLFRRLHALDIRRHEAPRNGPDAESKWDV